MSEKLSMHVMERGLFQYFKCIICNIPNFVPCTSDDDKNPEVSLDQNGKFVYQLYYIINPLETTSVTSKDNSIMEKTGLLQHLKYIYIICNMVHNFILHFHLYFPRILDLKLNLSSL